MSEKIVLNGYGVLLEVRGVNGY